MWTCVEWSDLSGQPSLADRLGRFDVQLQDARNLKLRGFLPAGVHKIEFATAPGRFDPAGLMFLCTEYPSMKQVPTGPWDLNHMTDRMVAPVVDIHRDGEFWAQGWARRSTPAAMKGGYVEFSLGIEIEKPGPHDILLAIPDCDDRWSWEDLDTLRVEPDERRPRRLTVRPDLAGARPRCFLGPQDVKPLLDALNGERRALWNACEESVDAGQDGTYFFRDVRLALGVLTGLREDWLDELSRRLSAAADRENWGFNPVRHAMGWNNDRDAGCALFAASVACDWCGERLPEDGRRRLRTRIVSNAEYVYRFTIVQRDYLPGGVEAHSLGTWFGLAAAAVAFYGEEPRAERWLDWLGGALDRIGRALPHDGVRDMNMFCAMFTFYLYGVLDEFDPDEDKPGTLRQKAKPDLLDMMVEVG